MFHTQFQSNEGIVARQMSINITFFTNLHDFFLLAFSYTQFFQGTGTLVLQKKKQTNSKQIITI